MTLIHHSIDPQDQLVMNEFHAALASAPTFDLAPEARPAFDALMSQVPHASTVSYEPATVAGIPGGWCRTKASRSSSAILYLHGGGFVLGSSAAYLHFAGQIASRAGADAFVPDYRLAPEHPFPAAIVDAMQAYDGLVALGYRHIALVGDSAGGGLALAALSQLTHQARTVAPICAAVMSAWTDLSLTGDSMETLARQDPLLSRETLSKAAALYLGGSTSPEDPRASALLSPLEGLPPVRLHVGADEVLLDDTLRFGRALEAAGGTAEVHVWEGMAHVFPATLALSAARQALDDIGTFLGQWLAPQADF